MDRVSRLIVAGALLASCVATPPDWSAHREPLAEGGPPVYRPSPAAPWTGWDDALPPQVRLDRIRGWTAAPAPPVRLNRVADAFSGHHPTAQLTAEAPNAALMTTLLPPAPIPIYEPADVVEAVAAAPRAVPSDGRPLPSLGVRLRDASGARHTVVVGPIPADRWTVLRAPLPTRFLRCDDEGRFGWIEAVELRDWDPSAAPDVRLASLAIGPRHAGLLLPPGSPDPPWRRPGVEDMPNAAPPPVRAAASVEWLADGRVALRSAADDGNLTFVVDPAAWHHGFEVSWNGRPRLRWRGWRIEGGAVNLAPRAIVAADDRLELDTASGGQVTMRLAGRTLSVRLRGPPATLAIVAAGWTGAPSEPIRLPMMEDIPVGVWPGEPMLFTTALFDPFRSSASEFGGGSVDASAFHVARYRAADDGRPHAVDETFHLTISTRIEDVLPSVPAVSGRRAADAAMSIYYDPGPFGLGRIREVWEALQAGPLLVLSEPAPGAPREDELDCTDPRWTREWARHTPDGRWRVGTAPGRYAIKTPWMAAAGALTGLRAAPTDRALVPRISADPPWAFTDYDARSAGAATFRSAWDGVLEWYRLESRRRAAPVLCDASLAWLYADAADGAVWPPTRAADLIEGPWLPLVPLLRLNRALRLVAPPVSLAGNDAAYRSLAAAIAHGMALRLPALDITDDRLWRWTFLSAALHRRQALQSIERLAWGTDGGGLSSASTALVNGESRRSRLYLRYRDGLEIWVNGDTGTWAVAIGGDTLELPPAGWYAVGPDLLAASSLRGGRRLDRVRSPEYAYHDGHGDPEIVDGLGCAEPLLVRLHERPRGQRLRLTFLRAPAAVGLGPPFWPNDARPVRVSAADPAGTSLPPPDPVRDGARLRLRPPPHARDVELEWTK